MNALTVRRRLLPVAALALVSAGAFIGGCLHLEPSCPQGPDPHEFCFAWPLPDGGTTGDPGACPLPDSDEARLDVETFGTPTDGSAVVGQGVTVLGGGTLKNGQCCYQVQERILCE